MLDSSSRTSSDRQGICTSYVFTIGALVDLEVLGASGNDGLKMLSCCSEGCGYCCLGDVSMLCREMLLPSSPSHR